MRFSQRPLRASVIRVVAAFAPAVGCADTLESLPVNPPACSSSNTPGCVPGVTTSDASVEPEISPTNPPLCIDEDVPGCEGGRSGDAGTRDATTPLDATVVETKCPVSAPVNGGACSLAASQSCEYEPFCGERPTRSARCVNGQWSVAISSCNPPPPVVCPLAEPAEDAGCNLAGGPGGCSYGSCDGGSAVTLQCTANVWQVLERCGKPACPSAAPVHGAPCSYAGPSCNYGSAVCGGAPDTLAMCVSGAWLVSRSSCNPPPPQCPGLAPAEGSACTVPSTFHCSFSLSAGGTVFGTCVEGKWKLGVADAGT